MVFPSVYPQISKIFLFQVEITPLKAGPRRNLGQNSPKNMFKIFKKHLWDNIFENLWPNLT